ncbi:MAG: aldo/keto reductase [Lactobacillus sp.]|nr:aldo/keto reductase [Lactobacillus sp.]
MAKFEHSFKLSDGNEIPAIGFGTWQTPDGEVARHAVKTAIDAGYRLIDTAAIYGNEESVGQGIKDSGIKREDLFVTTKLWNDAHNYEAAKKAIDDSLTRLDLDYLDLYLIHWPNPVKIRDQYEELNAETWRAMEEAQKAGKIRSLGISNFKKHHIDALMKTAEIKPVVNQIFLNPGDMQLAVQKENDKWGMLSEAYSPLGTGGMLGNETVKAIASKYGKSTAQILIRWSLEHGFLPLPKSVHDEYIKANFEVFDFKLEDTDIKELDKLDGTGAKATDPDTAEF